MARLLTAAVSLGIGIGKCYCWKVNRLVLCAGRWGSAHGRREGGKLA